MSSMYEQLVQNASQYADRRQRKLQETIGSGADGIVIATDLNTAIKVFRHQLLYLNERNVYMRLQERRVEKIEGFHVPKLVDYHDDLLLVEMEIVRPPFVVDFAGAYLDRPSPFSPEELQEWETSRQELFGDDWEQVQSVMAAFQGLGIILNDVKPGNVTVR